MYFSVIDQNNQINCLLHIIHFYLKFEFLLSAIMISYQNSSSQCMNFKRRGLVCYIFIHVLPLNFYIHLYDFLPK